MEQRALILTVILHRDLVHTMQSLSLKEQTEPLSPANRSDEPPPERHKLPALNSSEWGFEELTLPPPPRAKR